MEINITKFFNEEAPSDYSASVAELGRDAGTITWMAAKEAAAEDYQLLKTEEEFAAFRDWAGEFGAWGDEDIAKWSTVECNALLIQFIAGEMREANQIDAESWDWDEYEKDENAGNIFRADDGDIYFYMGS